MFRRSIKAIVENGLVWSGAASVTRSHHAVDTVILAYHNIVPAGHRAYGDASLHLQQGVFARQLYALSRTHDVVSLTDVLPGDADSPVHRSRPRAVITFDDAYQGAMTAGVAELRSHSLPATVFVAPRFIGGHPFWWDVIAEQSEGLSAEVREEMLSTSRGRHDEVLKLMSDVAGVSPELESNSIPRHARCASLDELTAALEYPELTLGSHTWSHPNLTCLDAVELAEELTAPRRWLERFGDRVLPVVSYPYGRADGTVWNAAKTAGYNAGLMVDGGWMRSGNSNSFAIPRLNIPAGVSDAGFVIRTAGLIGQ